MRVLLQLIPALSLYAADLMPGGLPPTPVTELPRLEKQLHNGNWNERIHAVHRLGAMGPAAQEALAQALNDLDWQVRFTAIHWLGRQGTPSIPALDTALRTDPCRLIRLNAVHWLGSLGPEALPSLEEALLDESGVVRMTDRYWIRKIEGDDRAGEPERNPGEELSACKRSELPLQLPEKTTARFEVPKEMKRKRERRKTDPSKGDSPEAAIAKAALAKQERNSKPPEDAAAEIDRLFGDPESLGYPEGPDRRLMPPVSSDAARENTDREDPEAILSKTVGRPLGLKQRLEAPKVPEGRTALSVSAEAETFDIEPHVPQFDPIPGLLESLDHEFPPIRARAADELGWLGAKAGRAVGALMIHLRDESPRVRASAALALGNIGAAADGALPQLKRALKDPSPDVRYSAAVALGRIGTPAAKKAFSHYLKNEAKHSIDDN